MTIAITGASGQLGRIAITALKSQTASDNILALARTLEKVHDLGVAAAAFDYKQPDGLVSALDGVETLGLISSSDFEDRVGQHKNVIAAAKEAGVKQVIYTSIVKAGASPLIISHDQKATEADLLKSGLDYTILRNNWYTENWTGSLPASIEAGAVIGCAGNAKVTPATRQDHAEALAAVAVGEGHANKIYELGCDVPFTMAEMAAELSRQVGKEILYNDVPADVYAGILDGFGLPEGFSAVVTDADSHAKDGWLCDESQTLSRLIGRPTTTLAAAVAAALA